MDAIARSLHLGGRSSDFYAHLHIVDLYNVPLVEGECKIKWRFKGAMHLNNVEKSQILDRAKEGTVGYLRKEGTVTSNAKGKGRERQDVGHDSDDDGLEQHEGGTTGHGHHSSAGHKLASFGKAILHPKASLRKRSNTHNRESSPNPGTTSDGSGEEDHLASSMQGRTPRASQMNAFSPYNSGPLSPAETIHPPSSPLLASSPSRISTRLSYGSTSNRDNINNNGFARINGTGHLSRMSTSLSTSQSRGLSLEGSPLASPSSASSKPFEPVTDSKGHTKYLSLVSNACSFDQHVVCAVAIPLEKSTNHLQACPVRLAVKHKVRVTPLPLSKTFNASTAERNVSSTSPSRDGRASSPSSSSFRHHSSPSSSTTSLLHHSSSSRTTNIKEEHEEIPLGEVVLDLSEFVEAGRSIKQSERWTSRRYLLQNGKTNALLRIAVRMEWLGGEMYYVPPPLATGQIIKEKQRERSGSKNDSSLSTQHHNGSSLMVHSNSSSRSINSVNGNGNDPSSRLRPPSILDNPSSRGGNGNGRPISQSSTKQRLQNKATESKKQGVSSSAIPDNSGMNVRNSDQQAIDLIEEIFSSKIQNTPISQSPNYRKAKNGTASAAVAANHGFEAASRNHKGPKAIRDANVHHDLDHAAHRGYHPPGDGHGLHNMQGLVRKVMDSPTEAQMIAKRALEKHRQQQQQQHPQQQQNDNTSPAKSWTAPHPSEISPAKQKRNLGDGERPDVTGRSTSSTNLLRRPFSGNRTVSNSSSLFMRRDNSGGNKSPGGMTASSSSSSSNNAAGGRKGELGKTLRPGRGQATSNNTEDATPTMERNGIDLDDPTASDTSIAVQESSDSSPQLHQGEWTGQQSTRSRTQSAPDSGRSSPVKQKSVSWEDAPPADKDQIEEILRQVALRQDERTAREERDAAAANSNSSQRSSSRNSSRSPSVKTGNGSRNNSPERSLARPKTSPSAFNRGRFSDASRAPQEMDSDERDRKRAESLRERGLLPSIALTTSRE